MRLLTVIAGACAVYLLIKHAIWVFWFYEAVDQPRTAALKMAIDRAVLSRHPSERQRPGGLVRQASLPICSLEFVRNARIDDARVCTIMQVESSVKICPYWWAGLDCIAVGTYERFVNDREIRGRIETAAGDPCRFLPDPAVLQEDLQEGSLTKVDMSRYRRAWKALACDATKLFGETDVRIMVYPDDGRRYVLDVLSFP